MSFMYDLYFLWYKDLCIQCDSQSTIDKYLTLHLFPAPEHVISLQMNLSSNSTAASLQLKAQKS